LEDLEILEKLSGKSDYLAGTPVSACDTVASAVTKPFGEGIIQGVFFLPMSFILNEGTIVIS